MNNIFTSESLDYWIKNLPNVQDTKINIKGDLSVEVIIKLDFWYWVFYGKKFYKFVSEYVELRKPIIAKVLIKITR